MRIVSIILIIFVFFIGIFFMKEVSKILGTSQFKGLSYNEKVDITANIKSNWKVSILLLSLLACELLVIISNIIGKTNNYESIVNMVTISGSIIVLVMLYFNNVRIEKYLKNKSLK